MHRIFKKHYEIFVQRVFNSKDAAQNFYNEISKFQRNKDLHDGEILHRFPKKELRYFLRAECPTEKLPEKKGVKGYEIIKSAKRLRYFMGIPENFVCTRCSKRDTCKFRDILPKSKETSVSDLLIVVNGVYDYRNQLYGESEAQEREKKTHEETLDDEEDINQQEEDKEGQEESEDQPEDRYIYKTYDSAIKVIDSLYPVMDDLNFRKGYGCKQYINAYIEENKNLRKGRNENNFDDSDQEEDFGHQKFVEKRSFRNNSPKTTGKKHFNDQEASWGSKPKKSFDNDKGERFTQKKRNPRKFENEFEEIPQRNQRNRDFSSNKKQSPNRSFEKDFDDEEDSFVVPKRSSIQRNSSPKQNRKQDFSDDNAFSFQPKRSGNFRNRQNDQIELRGDRRGREDREDRRERENREDRGGRGDSERSSGGRKLRRNKSTNFEEQRGQLNIDSFLHNVK